MDVTLAELTDDQIREYDTLFAALPSRRDGVWVYGKRHTAKLFSPDAAREVNLTLYVEINHTDEDLKALLNKVESARGKLPPESKRLRKGFPR